ncbi:MAG: N-acetyl sugar amidotransferase [bacterium]|nr:N-acetyl sugar amidotransferase [bacterium]
MITKTKYGLPSKVVFCKKCVISNQRPNSAVEYSHTGKSKKETINFDKDGVCDACWVTKNKEIIDWKKREKELLKLLDRFRKNDGSYDCVIPGSGGKDSFYTSHLLKYKYGMHPLTVTWAPHIYTSWGWKNFESWIQSGLDNILFTPNGKVHRLLTRLATENLFHPFQPFIIGQKALAPKIASLYKIPLVIYGENEAEYGNPIADNEKAKRDWAYFTAKDKSKIYLGGTSFSDLIKKYGVSKNDLDAYLPANPADILKNKIEVQYLGYYIKWHPQEAYYYAVEHGNFQASPERTPGTYSKYNSIDDKIDDLHYYTTFIKFGIGRATYDASQEVRSGEITREEGVSLVKRFDGEFPERFADELWEYLSITKKEFPKAYKMFRQSAMDKKYFMSLADKFRSPHLWKKEKGRWKLKRQVK